MEFGEGQEIAGRTFLNNINVRDKKKRTTYPP